MKLDNASIRGGMGCLASCLASMSAVGTECHGTVFPDPTHGSGNRVSRWNLRRGTLWLGGFLGLILLLTPTLRGQATVSTVLFETGFEAAEGYDPTLDLDGQNGWIAAGSGGNGVLAEAPEEFEGQAAYIGFQAPVPGQDQLNLYRPFTTTPIDESVTELTLEVSFMIFDSTVDAPHFDDFRWSVYNIFQERLFTLDFDNQELEINYILDDDEGFQFTGFFFDPFVAYDLRLVLYPSRNAWSAWINGELIVEELPITTRGAAIEITEIDAVWILRDPNNPGDNYMVFDDYRITVERPPPAPLRVEPVGMLTSGAFIVRVHGEPGQQYVVETTNNLEQWGTLGTGTAQNPGGFFDIQDTSGRHPQRLFRARPYP